MYIPFNVSQHPLLHTGRLCCNIVSYLIKTDKDNMLPVLTYKDNMIPVLTYKDNMIPVLTYKDNMIPVLTLTINYLCYFYLSTMLVFNTI